MFHLSSDVYELLNTLVLGLIGILIKRRIPKPPRY